MKEKRSMFSGKLGFVLAAAGSAVGLGNIWRFPYLAAKYGGGIFLLVYLILVVSLGFSLMIAEVAIGRKTKLSAIGAFRKLSEKWKFLGYLASVVPMVIFPYYCVIGGWVVKYLAVYVSGGGLEAAGDSYFSDFIAKPGEPILWLALYVGLTAVIVFFGVQKGIEKASRVMMPALVVLTIGVAAYSVTRPGALDGVAYYLIPDFSRFSVNTVLGAMGQMFYSMSLAMGIMVTYGSYMKREDDLEKSVSQIEIFDTGIAFLAGLMVIPAVFAFSGGDEAALNQGAGLMFVTLPKVFADAGTLGLVFGGAVLPAGALRGPHLLRLPDGDGGLHLPGHLPLEPEIHLHPGDDRLPGAGPALLPGLRPPGLDRPPGPSPSWTSSISSATACSCPSWPSSPACSWAGW